MVKRLALVLLLLSSACGQTTATTEEPAAYYTTEAPAEAPASPFTSRDVGSGVQIEYPSHWQIVSDAEIAAASARVASLASNEATAAQSKRTLIAVNATPQPTGAMLRVSTIAPATITQVELERAINSGEQVTLLHSVEESFAAQFPAMMDQLNITVSNIATPEIVRVAGRPAILIAYRRTSAVDGALWEVRQYHIASGDQTIELTLSNRLSDRDLWTPILDRTLSTLQIQRAP